MFFNGFLSLVQIVVLPGWVVAELLKLNGWPKVALVFPLSLIVNYMLVVGLVSLGLYSQTMLYSIVALEILLLVGMGTRNKLNSQAFVKLDLLKNWNADDFYKILEIVFTVVVLFVLVKYLVTIFPAHFDTYDDKCNWARWATSWYNSEWPVFTWDYPQMLPAIWSMTYKFIGTDEIEYFATIFNGLTALAIPAIFAILHILNPSKVPLLVTAVSGSLLMFFMKTPNEPMIQTSVLKSREVFELTTIFLLMICVPIVFSKLGNSKTNGTKVLFSILALFILGHYFYFPGYDDSFLGLKFLLPRVHTAIGRGRADVLTAFWGTISVFVIYIGYYRHLSKKQFVLLNSLTLSGALMAKQAGYFLAPFSLISLVFILSRMKVSKTEIIKSIFIFISIVLFLGGSWYIYKKIEFEAGASQSGTIVHYVTQGIYNGKSYLDRFLEANENIANTSITFLSFEGKLAFFVVNLIFIFVFLGYYLKSFLGKIVTFSVIIPFYFTWSIFFSYGRDLRNFALIIPFITLGIVCGMSEWQAKLKKTTVLDKFLQPVQYSLLFFLSFLLMFISNGYFKYAAIGMALIVSIFWFSVYGRKFFGQFGTKKVLVVPKRVVVLVPIFLSGTLGLIFHDSFSFGHLMDIKVKYSKRYSPTADWIYKKIDMGDLKGKVLTNVGCANCYSAFPNTNNAFHTVDFNNYHEVLRKQILSGVYQYVLLETMWDVVSEKTKNLMDDLIKQNILQLQEVNHIQDHPLHPSFLYKINNNIVK